MEVNPVTTWQAMTSQIGRSRHHEAPVLPVGRERGRCGERQAKAAVMVSTMRNNSSTRVDDESSGPGRGGGQQRCHLGTAHALP